MNDKYLMDTRRYDGWGISALDKKMVFLRFLRKEESAKNPFLKKIYRALKRCALKGTGCDIGIPSIGGGLAIAHFSGIVLSDFATIGENCTLFHQVTIGVNDFIDPHGAPVLGDNVYVGCGAKIIGPISIGDNVRIGANAVVTKDVPSDSTVVGFNRIL